MAEKQTTPPAQPPAGAQPPAPEVLSDAMKAAIQEAVDAAFQNVIAEARARAESEGDFDPADAPLEKRTIRHGMFSYDLPGGGQAIAMRGDTVDLLPHDVARGEKFDAFTAKVGQMPEPPAASTLPVLSAEASDAEADAWVESGTVPEIVDAVNARPEILSAVLAAEQRRKSDARKSLLEALAKMNGGE